MEQWLHGTCGWRRGIVAAQCLPFRRQERDLLDRRRQESRGAHRVAGSARAGGDAIVRQLIQRGERLRQPRIRHGYGAVGGVVDRALAMPGDQVAKPEIEDEQRHAGEDDPDGNRDQILARERAHSLSHSAAKAEVPHIRPDIEPRTA